MIKFNTTKKLFTTKMLKKSVERRHSNAIQRSRLCCCAEENNSKVAQFKCNLSQQTSCRATEKKRERCPLGKRGSSDDEFSSGGENRPRADHFFFVRI